MAAAQALLDVEGGAHAEEALRRRAPERADDRRLAWHLVMGVLRRRPTLDAALAPHLSRPLQELDPAVRAVLRAAAFERLASRTEPAIAVHQAVETSRALGAGRASGLVNAVVRRVEMPRGLSRADRLDHPAWLVARWDERYGEEPTEAWCLSNGEMSPTFVVAKQDPARVAEGLCAAGLEATPVVLQGTTVTGVLEVTGHQGSVEQLPGFESGAFWIQDAASAWLADLVPETSRSVLDATAAPGGKTLRLASRGMQVVALDRDPARLASLRMRLAATRLEAEVHRHTWLVDRAPERRFDAVLVDAPCTGLGTLRRRPDVRWRRSPLDPAAASHTQRAILAAAAAHVAPGGALVYVVCSAEPEEGPGVVEAMAREGWVIAEVRCTAPPERGEDAFWGARLVRA